MGQYYKAYIEKDGHKYVLDSWDYGNGAKLMEHSWLGNGFVDAAYTLIKWNPAKVGWIGDYSNDVGVDEEIYEYAWRTDEHNSSIDAENMFRSGDEIVGYGYLTNHTKKEYVDIAKYTDLAKDNDGWTINPLPLLTAIGNGQGGGDYWGDNVEMVGYWYMDTIEFDPDRCEEGYSNITEDVVFREK